MKGAAGVLAILAILWIVLDTLKAIGECDEEKITGARKNLTDDEQDELG